MVDTVRSGKYGFFFQLLSNLGVIGGLVFLGLQILQDRHLKEAEITVATYTDEQNRLFVLMGENPAAALSKTFNGEPLSGEEIIVARAYFQSRKFAWARSSTLEKSGLISTSWRDGFIFTDRTWANQYGLDVMNEVLNQEDLYVPEFVDRIRLERERLQPLVKDGQTER